MTDIEHLARLNKLENRIMKIEDKQAKIINALQKLADWIDSQGAIRDSDTKIFDSIRRHLEANDEAIKKIQQQLSEVNDNELIGGIYH
jgi:predicted translin family RNA/ssDNA-binding protein